MDRPWDQGVSAYGYRTDRSVFLEKGVSFATVSAFFDWPILRMIPIIGWEISAFHLILLSPDLLNAVGTVLYILTTILFVILAYRMRVMEIIMRTRQNLQIPMQK